MTSSDDGEVLGGGGGFGGRGGSRSRGTFSEEGGVFGGGGAFSEDSIICYPLACRVEEEEVPPSMERRGPVMEIASIEIASHEFGAPLKENIDRVSVFDLRNHAEPASIPSISPTWQPPRTLRWVSALPGGRKLTQSLRIAILSPLGRPLGGLVGRLAGLL